VRPVLAEVQRQEHKGDYADDDRADAHVPLGLAVLIEVAPWICYAQTSKAEDLTIRVAGFGGRSKAPAF